jgi:hypothetical protein
VQHKPARWRAPLIGGALAAGAAVVAVLLMRPQPAEFQADLAESRAAAATRPLLAANVPDEQEASVTNQRLTNYLVAHGQVANALGRRNVWSGLLAADPAIMRASYDVAE